MGNHFSFAPTLLDCDYETMCLQ